MNLAVDASNYTGALRVGDIQCWKANGVERVIVQAVNPPPSFPPTQTVQQLRACAETPIRSDAYVYLWWSLSLSDIVGKLGLLKGYTIGRIWLDIEDDPGGMSVGNMVNKIAGALKLLEDHSATDEPAGIYTGKWWWDQHMEGYQGFADVPLWDAKYDGIPDPAVWEPFGGWSKLTLKQYRGTTSLCGVGGIDLSVVAPQEVQTPNMIHVGQGMQAQMSAAGDHPLFGHRFHDETDEDGQTYNVEICYGLKGLYVSANSSGQWENAGPMGGSA